VNRTPFYQFHVDHGAKMVEFAGYEMPLHYGSVLEEHRAVREALGMFDVSHMGRFRFSGRGARRFLERLCTRRVSDMQPGQCRYALVCNERGGVMDDVIVYRFDTNFEMVCNAANRAKLAAHFDAVMGDLAVRIDDVTEKTGMVAIQGPRAIEFISQFSREIPTLKRYRFTVKNFLVLKLMVSRTGYTGEDGVEVILPANMVGMAMKLLMREGDVELKPCGLAARDTLRLEAGMHLYGHELSEEIDPISAGLSFAVALDKEQDTAHGDPEPFIGMDAVKQIAEQGPKRKLVGLSLDGRRSPRQHMAVQAGGETIGEVTSGCLSPTLGKPIAMAYVDAAHAEPGAKVQVALGSAAVEAEVVTLPFYKAK